MTLGELEHGVGIRFGALRIPVSLSAWSSDVSGGSRPEAEFDFPRLGLQKLPLSVEFSGVFELPKHGGPGDRAAA